MKSLRLPEGNIALAAIKQHKETRAAKLAASGVVGAQIVPAGNPTTQPLPPARQVHICVVCHTKDPASITKATWVTNIGHTLCDAHKLEHDQTGHLPIMRKLHP